MGTRRDSPAVGSTAPGSVSAISNWEQQHDHTVDAAESKPPLVLQHPGNSMTEGIAENIVEPSASTVSAVAESWWPVAPAAANDKADGPTDDEIVAQENLIRAEEAEKLPLVGDLETLAALQNEYMAGNQVFLEKINSLQASYGCIRRARGDGNCFFRSFIFGYLESLVLQNNLSERDRMMVSMREWRKRLVQGGFQELVWEDAEDVLMSQLASIGQLQDPLTVDSLVSNMRDATISNMAVMYLRMLTSCEIQRRQEFFAPFIMGMSDEELSIEVFCRRCVEPMGEESDHVHIVALSDALQVPIRVVYLDCSLNSFGGGAETASVNLHDSVPEGVSDPSPRVHVLYRPGHYDILYPCA